MSDCGVCLYGDGDVCTLGRTEWPKARKQYKCEECYRPILVGEKHQLCVSLYEGEWSRMRTCAVCAEIRSAFYCEGEVIGMFWDQFEECFEELNVSCLDKLTTAAAKQYLMQRWQEWKGLKD